MSEFKYNDILNMKYPNIETEIFFGDAVLREAQFAPFAALTGHDDAIKETARITDEKIELDEYEKEDINHKLVYIKDNIKSAIETGSKQIITAICGYNKFNPIFFQSIFFFSSIFSPLKHRCKYSNKCTEYFIKYVCFKHFRRDFY
jgi:hypothetical protein